jgi:hypothetical protein
MQKVKDAAREEDSDTGGGEEDLDTGGKKKKQKKAPAVCSDSGDDVVVVDVTPAAKEAAIRRAIRRAKRARAGSPVSSQTNKKSKSPKKTKNPAADKSAAIRRAAEAEAAEDNTPIAVGDINRKREAAKRERKASLRDPPEDLDTGGKKKKQKKDPDAVCTATLSSEQRTVFVHQRMVAAAPELDPAVCSDSDDDVVVVNVTTEAERTALAKAEAIDLSSGMDEQAEESSAGAPPKKAVLHALIGQMVREKNFHCCTLCFQLPTSSL